MFNSSSQAARSGGVHKAVSALATAIGLGVAVMASPALFAKAKAPLYAYFFSYAGDPDVATILVWVMDAISAFVIFAVVSMILTFMMIWLLAKLAVKSLG